MPIKKLHCFFHSKSKTSAIQACATPKDLRWNILMNMVKTASTTIIIIIIEYNEWFLKGMSCDIQTYTKDICKLNIYRTIINTFITTFLLFTSLNNITYVTLCSLRLENNYFYIVCCLKVVLYLTFSENKYPNFCCKNIQNFRKLTNKTLSSFMA
jgi:hypothetical protein